MRGAQPHRRVKCSQSETRVGPDPSTAATTNSRKCIVIWYLVDWCEEGCLRASHVWPDKHQIQTQPLDVERMLYVLGTREFDSADTRTGLKTTIHSCWMLVAYLLAVSTASRACKLAVQVVNSLVSSSCTVASPVCAPEGPCDEKTYLRCYSGRESIGASMTAGMWHCAQCTAPPLALDSLKPEPGHTAAPNNFRAA